MGADRALTGRSRTPRPLRGGRRDGDRVHPPWGRGEGRASHRPRAGLGSPGDPMDGGGARAAPPPQPDVLITKGSVYWSTLLGVMRMHSKSCFSDAAPVSPDWMKLSAWRTASAEKIATGWSIV